MKFSRYLIGSLCIAALLSFGACSDEIPAGADMEVAEKGEDDGMVDVTIHFTLEDEGTPGTRADGDEDATATDMRNIDLFIYALRDENDVVLLQYGKGVSDEFKIDDPENQGKKVINKEDYPALANYKEDADNNQTLMKVTWDEKAGVHENAKIYQMSDTITLRVMRGTVFKLSCWAQSSQTTAFDFNNFTAVKVDYDDAKNNDITRDAFCATSIFSIGQVDSDISVTLTRPFAQVNVGMFQSREGEDSVDTGTDPEEEDSDDTDTDPGCTESSITLEGVAKFFNVVDNKVWTQNDIDKYINSLGPNDKSVFNEKDKEKIKATTDVTFNKAPIIDGTFYVHNYNNGEPTLYIYKTLSMCYVLVPETVSPSDTDGNYEESGGVAASVTLTLTSLSLYGPNGILTLKPKIRDAEGNPILDDSNNEQDLTISVKRNWRSNLLYPSWKRLKMDIPPVSSN